jgi:hypothetical protein
MKNVWLGGTRKQQIMYQNNWQKKTMLRFEGGLESSCLLSDELILPDMNSRAAGRGGQPVSHPLPRALHAHTGAARHALDEAAEGAVVGGPVLQHGGVGGRLAGGTVTAPRHPASAKHLLLQPKQ